MFVFVVPPGNRLGPGYVLEGQDIPIRTCAFVPGRDWLLNWQRVPFLSPCLAKMTPGKSPHRKVIDDGVVVKGRRLQTPDQVGQLMLLGRQRRVICI